MKLRIFPLLFIWISFATTSCLNKNKQCSADLPKDVIKDSLGILDNVVNDSIKKRHEVKEFKENLLVIEKKYGEQWGFCECVVANDSIDKAVKNMEDFDSPAAEKLLERFDYVSTKCQAFLNMDASKTPEQREAHQKKVKKCLKNVKN